MKKRLDIMMVEQGLAPSREKAKAYIMAGCLAILGLAVSFYAATSVEPVTNGCNSYRKNSFG